MEKPTSLLRQCLLMVVTAIIPLGMWGMWGMWWFVRGDHHWEINRILPSSPLYSVSVSPTDSGSEAMREAVRKEVPKGTSIEAVRRYIGHHFVDDGRLVFEDTIVNKTGSRPWPPRIRITVREGGATFAGSHHTRLAFFFDDDGHLDAVNVEAGSSYL